MSRADAIEALRGRHAPVAYGLSWVPTMLLDEVVAVTGATTRAQATAVTAASIPVDLAFVAAEGPDASDTVAALHAADIAAVWSVDGVFTRVSGDVGWSETLRMTAAAPDELASRLDAALHRALVAVRAAVEAGADSVLIGDDLAGPGGPLMPPDYIIDALVPRYEQLAQEAGVGGLPALFHSDGEIRALLPALARAGMSGVHLAGLDEDAFAASATAARQEGLVVLGGISVQALARGARVAGGRAAAIAGSLGGVVVCDDGGITTFEELVAAGAALGAARDAARRR